MLLNIKLRFMAVSCVAIVLTACGKKDEQQTASAPPANVSSSKLEANDENCRKVTGVTSGFTQNAAAFFHTSTSNIKFLRMHESSTCIAVVDTPNGPKMCGVDSVIKTETGEYIGHWNSVGGFNGCIG